MSLLSAQLIILKAAILAETNPTFVTYRNEGRTEDMRIWLDSDSNTDAWNDNVIAKTLDEAADYTTFDNIAAGKRDTWSIFLAYAPRDMSKNKNRKVVTDVWGSAVTSSISESILQSCIEKASRGELVFGGNDATTGTVTAIKREWVGSISREDIEAALRL